MHDSDHDHDRRPRHDHDPARPPAGPGFRVWNDMGGDPAGPVDLSEHDYALWEKRVDALLVLCSARGLFTVDGLRRALEDMGPEAFRHLTYYERWIAAISRNLVEAGAFSPAELAERMAEVAARGPDYGAASLGAPRG